MLVLGRVHVSRSIFNIRWSSKGVLTDETPGVVGNPMDFSVIQSLTFCPSNFWGVDEMMKRFCSINLVSTQSILLMVQKSG